MISIIICSRTPDISRELKQNIATTIGCDFELVVIDNSSNSHSIFSAYNEGVEKAKGDLLCFMHEDVLYREEDWGVKMGKHFQDDSIGLVGFAGSHFLPSTPMYWYSSPFVSQRNLNNDEGVVEEHFHEDWFGAMDIIDVCVCDGLCFFVRKSLFDVISFDEKTYHGFHLYDMDICMQVIESGKRVCVCRDVLVEHCWSEEKQFSKQGAETFAANLSLFSEKWKNSLPIWRGLPMIPMETFERLNAVYGQLHRAELIRRSKAYRLGHFILHPIHSNCKK